MTFSRSRMPDLNALQAFEAAARYESFTLAAAELDLSQSAISRQIKVLEERLGITLFERVRQRVVLSESGKRLLADVRDILSRTEHMTLRAMGTRGLTGALSIATLPTFARRWLIPRLPDFLSRQPGIQVSLSSRSTPFDLTSESFDLAIHYGRPSWPHASCTFLCSEIVVPVAAPCFLKDARRLEAGEVAELPLLHLDTRPKLWEDWFTRSEVATEHSYRGHRFDQFSMVIAAALAGLGVALLPSYLIEEEIAAGRLVIVADLPMETEFSYYVVVPEDKSSNDLSLAFQSWIMRQVRPAPLLPEDLIESLAAKVR